MCGRYILRQQAKALREWERYGPPAFADSFNIAPSHAVPVLRRGPAGPEYAQMRWGLVPFFARGKPPSYSTINARIETLATAPCYRGPWRRGQRCLQLASGFYEWRIDEDGRKRPYLISVVDQELFGLAAVWERSIGEDGSALESCAHITLPANELLRDIHNAGPRAGRMPAIVAAEDHEVWLYGSLAEAHAVLRPYPAALMLAHPVSARVNSVRNNSPELIEPLAA